MAVRNSTERTRKQQYKRENNKRPKNNRPSGQAKPCKRYGRAFDQEQMKSCAAFGKTCKNCRKPNHFAKICRSQQVSEVTEDSKRLEEESDFIREDFGSCSDFEVMSIQPHRLEGERNSNYKGDRINESNRQLVGKSVRVQKIDLLKDPTSNKVKPLRAMLRVDNRINQLTVDTGSPVSFLNWSTTKEIINKSNKARFIQAEKLNLATLIVDYKKQTICVLGALKTNLRSAGSEVKGATFLVTERKTRCKMGLDLQGQVRISTTQKPKRTVNV